MQKKQEMQVQTLGQEDTLEEEPTVVFFLEDLKDTGAGQATIHTVAKSWTKVASTMISFLSQNSYPSATTPRFNLSVTIQFSSVAQWCLTLWDPMEDSTPGLPVHHQLSEFTQTHVHRVGDAMQPSHRLSSPSPPAFNLSQLRGLLQWVGSSHQVAKGLELQLQHHSFQCNNNPLSTKRESLTY